MLLLKLPDQFMKVENPLICKIGKTAPSLIGLINLLLNQLAASGPVSASPSPISTAAMTAGQVCHVGH